jgi:hypothetical protein
VTFGFLTLALEAAGRLADALAEALEGIEAGRRLGLERFQGTTLTVWAAHLCFKLGRWQDADRYGRAAVAATPMPTTPAMHAMNARVSSPRSCRHGAAGCCWPPRPCWAGSPPWRPDRKVAAGGWGRCCRRRCWPSPPPPCWASCGAGRWQRAWSGHAGCPRSWPLRMSACGSRLICTTSKATHLQVIALKSELAARLAQTDPARAAVEMQQVQRLSTEALRDTRAVVQGYRRTSLDEEIANATRVLAAADIDARMQLDADTDSDRLSETSRHLLGLVVREATTNVLRHSQAERAQVDYRVAAGVAQLRMGNDGAVDQPGASPGSGLRTLAERLVAAGAR